MSHRVIGAFIVIVFSSILSFSAIATNFDKIAIVNTAFTVKAGDARYWTFNVRGNDARVVGRFRAEGGSGNDIRCLILDADAFENWRNGHNVRTYYNSNKITVANINVNLGAGEYILVFDNTFSPITGKAVTANVEVQQ